MFIKNVAYKAKVSLKTRGRDSYKHEGIIPSFLPFFLPAPFFPSLFIHWANTLCTPLRWPWGCTSQISNWIEYFDQQLQLLCTEIYCHISCQGHASRCYSRPHTECSKAASFLGVTIPSVAVLAQGLPDRVRTAQQSQVLPAQSFFPPSPLLRVSPTRGPGSSPRLLAPPSFFPVSHLLRALTRPRELHPHDSTPPKGPASKYNPTWD